MTSDDDKSVRLADVLAVLHDEGWLGHSVQRIRALPAATPRSMREAPQRFAVRAVRTEEGRRGSMGVAKHGNWVRWDDVAHLFPHPEAPHD